MNKAAAYVENVRNIIDEVLLTQLDSIESASRELSLALQQGRRIFLFGTGHSHMLAEEMFFRAGGLVKVQPIFEEALMLHTSASKSAELQQLSGYANIIFDHYSMKKGDVLIVFSYSGQSGVCIDMAKLANEKGLILIAITNAKKARLGASYHSSGKNLYEYADIIIENVGSVSDASIKIDGVNVPVAPTSTVIGSMIVNAVVARTVEMLAQKGIVPEVFAGGDGEINSEIDNKYISKYIDEIKFL